MFAALPLFARPLLLVHVMPWFAAPPLAKEFGWHWTMGRTNAAAGKLASHYHPLGGPYDSSDADVIERQTLLMKVAGFDGMLVDWYGDRDRYDYLPNHRVTQKLFAAAKDRGLSFALVYEDQTVPNLLSGGIFPKEADVREGKALLARAAKSWFGSPTYQKVNGKPLLMVFGPQYYRDELWSDLLPTNVAFYTLHRTRGPAAGAFDWPLPGPGWEARRKEVAKANANLIPVAFPRFDDYYKEGGVGPGYGKIPDADGRTLATTLADAIAQGAPVVQVATWNDWGEGTQIEPSVEFGMRDLKTVQSARRKIDPGFRFSAEDLDLPSQLFRLRKGGARAQKLDAAAKALSAGHPSAARAILKSVPVG